MKSAAEPSWEGQSLESFIAFEGTRWVLSACLTTNRMRLLQGKPILFTEESLVQYIMIHDYARDDLKLNCANHQVKVEFTDFIKHSWSERLRIRPERRVTVERLGQLELDRPTLIQQSAFFWYPHIFDSAKSAREYALDHLNYVTSEESIKRLSARYYRTLVTNQI